MGAGAFQVRWVVGLTVVAGLSWASAQAYRSFARFDVRSKQRECRAVLQQLAASDRALFARTGAFAESFDELEPVGTHGHRYSYFLSPTEMLPADATSLPQVLDVDPLAALEAARIYRPDGEGPPVITCVGNLDEDDTLDVWTIDLVTDSPPVNLVNDVER
jgi:hypothetical protein